MKRRDFVTGALALSAAPAYARPAISFHDAPRMRLSPPFIDGTGRELTLADFRGQVVLVNVWATWCGPCREEMPALDALQTRIGGENFHVLPLSIDRGGLESVRRFYREIGILRLGTYVAEELRAMLAFGVTGLPTTMLIDRDGREIARRVGPAEWDSPEAVAQFQSVIARTKTR